MNAADFPVTILKDAMSGAQRFPKIYPLEPHGLGTGSIECLTSYICRLAAQHSMLTAVFLREVLVPAMPARNRVHHKIINYSLYTADGYGLMARRLVEAFSKLQGTRQTEWLTALPWATVFSRTGSGLHPATFRRWCPLCWRQDAATGNTVYGRLAWTIGEVTICHHHRILLREACPRCKKVQLAIPGIPFLDRCSHCGYDLKLAPIRPVKVAARSKMDWMARAVDKLIERTCATQTALDPLSFKTRLREYIDRYADGNVTAFAKLINIGHSQIRNWLSKQSNPGFVVAMDILYRLDCPPDRFLLDSFELLPQTIWRRRLNRPRFVTKQCHTEVQIRKMEMKLDKIVKANLQPPPLITDIARKLKVRYCFLRYRFPMQYQIIAQRSTDFRATTARKKYRDRIGRLQRGYRQLLARGIYPSQRSLRREGLLRPSELRLSTIRAELGRLHRGTLERITRHRRKTQSSKAKSRVKIQ